jgi:hypothetical protein
MGSIPGGKHMMRSARRWVSAGMDMPEQTTWTWMAQRFGSMNLDKFLSVLKEYVYDWKLKRLIRRFLTSGVLTGSIGIPMIQAAPPCGPTVPY